LVVSSVGVGRVGRVVVAAVVNRIKINTIPSCFDLDYMTTTSIVHKAT
jgi:proteasome assembly chaperone (PAC2) family protein